MGLAVQSQRGTVNGISCKGIRNTTYLDIIHPEAFVCDAIKQSNGSGICVDDTEGPMKIRVLEMNGDDPYSLLPIYAMMNVAP